MSFSTFELFINGIAQYIVFFCLIYFTQYLWLAVHWENTAMIFSSVSPSFPFSFQNLMVLELDFVILASISFMLQLIVFLSCIISNFYTDLQFINFSLTIYNTIFIRIFILKCSFNFSHDGLFLNLLFTYFKVCLILLNNQWFIALLIFYFGILKYLKIFFYILNL